MNSTWKGIAVLVLIVLLIFGATIVSMYTGSTDTKDTPTDGSDAIIGPPLNFSTKEVYYDPQDEESSVRRYFTGFYEAGETYAKVWIWFKNEYTIPVNVAVLGRSCSRCTSASLAIVDSPGSTQYATRASVAGGAMAVLPFKLNWNTFNWEKPEETIEVPAAASKDDPTVGLLELVIKVAEVGSATRTADFGMTAGTAPQSRMQFRVTLVGTTQFALSPKLIDFGSLKETDSKQSKTIYYWSATRNFSELPAPVIAVNTTDPYLEIGPVEPMTDEERGKLELTFISEGKVARVKSGYKVPVTLHRQLTKPVADFPLEPDIGPYERQIGFAGPPPSSDAATVKANIIGQIGLEDGLNIDLKDFESRFGTEKTVNLVSDRKDLTLEKIEVEFLPKFLEVTLSEPTNESGRRFWSLKVVVPKGQLGSELPANSVLVFRAKSPTGSFIIRIPVKGRAFDRVK